MKNEYVKAFNGLWLAADGERQSFSFSFHLLSLSPLACIQFCSNRRANFTHRQTHSQPPSPPTWCEATVRSTNTQITNPSLRLADLSPPLAFLTAQMPGFPSAASWGPYQACSVFLTIHMHLLCALVGQMILSCH